MSAPRGPVERWYSVADVADLLGVDKRRARAWAQAGDLGRVVDLGACGWRVPASGVSAFLADRVISAGAVDPEQEKPAEMPAGIAARSEGELRRKLAVAGGRFF